MRDELATDMPGLAFTMRGGGIGHRMCREFGTALGRHQTLSAAPAAAKRTPLRSDRQRNLEIRRWAEEHHLPIKARGKISDAVIAKYEAAHAERA
jgi:hypothetical protein